MPSLLPDADPLGSAQNALSIWAPDAHHSGYVSDYQRHYSAGTFEFNIKREFVVHHICFGL